MGRYPNAVWTPSPNCWPGRAGYQPRWIIIHGTAGGGSVSWLTNPQSQVSAHYVVTQDGKVYQLVEDAATAWANGIIEDGHDSWWSIDTNPNFVTLSIEHEKPDTANATPLTAAQSLSSFQLISWLCQRWNIPARPADASGGITGHYSIQPESRAHCPGVYPWSGLWQYLQQEHGDSLNMLSLSSPMGGFFIDKGNDRWHCKNTNVDVAYAHLDFFRRYEGVFGLPLTNELALANLPGVTIQCYERAIAIYDPKHTQEGANPATTVAGGPVYLLRIDRGIGQQIIAKPLVAALNSQISQLKAQIANQPADNTAEIETLKKQVAAYQQALQAIRSAASVQ